MKVYSEVVIDIQSGNVVREVSEEWNGDVWLCKGGVGKSDFPSYMKWHHKTACIEATNIMEMLSRSGVYAKLNNNGDVERYEYSREYDDNPYLFPVYDRIAWTELINGVPYEHVIYDPNLIVEDEPLGKNNAAIAMPAFLGIARASVVNPDVFQRLRGMDTTSDIMQSQADYQTAKDMLGSANDMFVEAARAMNISVENDIDSLNEDKVGQLIAAITESERDALESEISQFKQQMVAVGGVMSSAYANGLAKIYDNFLSRIHETAAKVKIDLQMRRAEIISRLIEGYVNTKKYISERTRDVALENLNYAKLYYDMHRIYLKEIRDYAQTGLEWYSKRMMPWRDMIGAMAGTTSLSLGKEDVGIVQGIQRDFKATNAEMFK